MQKKLIALAIAGLAAAPAFAQTNVTIYGVADLTEEYVSATDAATFTDNLGNSIGGDSRDIKGRTRLSSNSSLIGFRGTEDLGNGLKAIFQFETGITADTGFGSTNNASLSPRDTFVGLTGAWGTIVGGNLTSPIRNMGNKVSMSPGATGIGYQAATYGTILGLKTGSDDRSPNAVAYVTPALMGGLTFTGAWVNGENKRDSNTVAAGQTQAQVDNGQGTAINSYAWQLAAQYDAGPLYAGIGYEQFNDPQILGSVAGRLQQLFDPNASVTLTPNPYSDDLYMWRAAATYTFATKTKVGALVDWQKYKFNGTTALPGNFTGLNVTSGEISRYAYDLGVSQDFGPHTVYGEWSRAQKASRSGDFNNITDLDLGNTSYQQWTLGYNYNFSKRTMLKAYWSKISNKSNSFADFYINPVGNSTQALFNGADPNGFGVGLRHVF